MNIQTSDHMQGASTFIEMLVLAKTSVYPACEQRVGQTVLIVGACVPVQLTTVALRLNLLKPSDFFTYH
jgi:hypothetical protein